jgi:hypothetical protein
MVVGIDKLYTVAGVTFAKLKSFIFSVLATTSKLTLWPTKPTAQEVSWASSPRSEWKGREANHSPPSSAEVDNERNQPSLPYNS